LKGIAEYNTQIINNIHGNRWWMAGRRYYVSPIEKLLAEVDSRGIGTCEIEMEKY